MRGLQLLLIFLPVALLAHLAGIGGLLNATFGNAAELIITLTAIRASQMQLVLASITGSILGNLLLVLGFAMLLGGLKNGRQMFDRRHVDTDATMTILALIAMSVPSLFSLYIPDAMFFLSSTL